MGAEGLTFESQDSPRRLFKKDDPIYQYFRHVQKGLQRRGKARKRSCTLTIDFLINLYKKQQGLCALTKFKMTLDRDCSKTYYHPLNVSVDRIDNNIGYEPGNVQLICQQINVMRGTLTIEDFKSFCKKVAEHLE